MEIAGAKFVALPAFEDAVERGLGSFSYIGSLLCAPRFGERQSDVAAATEQPCKVRSNRHAETFYPTACG